MKTSVRSVSHKRTHMRLESDKSLISPFSQPNKTLSLSLSLTHTHTHCLIFTQTNLYYFRHFNFTKERSLTDLSMFHTVTCSVKNVKQKIKVKTGLSIVISFRYHTNIHTVTHARKCKVRVDGEGTPFYQIFRDEYSLPGDVTGMMSNRLWWEYARVIGRDRNLQQRWLVVTGISDVCLLFGRFNVRRNMRLSLNREYNQQREKRTKNYRQYNFFLSHPLVKIKAYDTTSDTVCAVSVWHSLWSQTREKTA